MSDQGGAKVTLSVEQMPEREGIRKWREYLSEVYCRQDVQILSTERLGGSISKRSVGDIIVSSFHSGGAQRVVRTRELAQLDGVEHFQFVFPTAGRFSYQQGNRECCAAAGDSFILNASQAFRINFSDDAESMVVAVPSDSMRKRIIGMDDFAAQSALSDQLLIRMITDLSSHVLNIESGTSCWKIQELLLDLLDVAVTEARNRRVDRPMSSGFVASLVEELRGVIGAKCADPAFRLSDLASSCGVSRRQIQKLLNESQTTFSDELMNARLAKAAHLLKKRYRSSVPIGRIAEQCGFTNKSHFSSSYKRRFGLSPRKHQGS